MLGNLLLGVSALGSGGGSGEAPSLVPPRISISGLPVDYNISVKRSIGNKGSVCISTNSVDTFILPNDATIKEYSKNLCATIRRPIYKIELLRQEDETPYYDIAPDVICDSGTINVERQNGVRRTSCFELSNVGNKYGDLVEHLTICSKYRISVGEEVNGREIFFRKGTYVFDNPTISGGAGDLKISIAGTDKWSILNGQHGGILEGTYTVTAGSKLGEFIRKTLALNVVNDPIEPLIHPELEEAEITYDITKSDGSTIADVLLDVALNTNSDIFYDEYGRLNVVPTNIIENRPVVKRFVPEDYSYTSANKTYNNDRVYNSVLVVGENIQDSNTPIRYELENKDLDDPNSIPNVGVKKVYKVSEYTSGIDTEEKARQRAVYELRNIREKSASVGVEYLDIMYLDVDQVVELEDDTLLSESSEKYVITTLTHNIGINLSVAATISKILNN